MGIKLGQCYICDRCGKSAFKPKIGSESTFVDGEIEEIPIFEDTTDWDYIYPDRKMTSRKLLCPECGKSFDVVMRKFMNLEI